MFSALVGVMAQYNQAKARKAQMDRQAKAEAEEARRTMQAYLDANPELDVHSLSPTWQTP